MADAGSSEKRSDSESPKPPQEVVSVTHGRVKINGTDIPYTATAGTIVLYEDDPEFKQAPKAKATVFYVAYTRSDIDDQTTRPITFSFNGGPGSASVWMHLGLLGPKRVLMADETGNLPAPPFRLVENEYSLLDQSDLVFIDPISTGYSRAATGENPNQFHQFTKDIESISDFIRLYTTRSKRWLSPKYIIGESYGTTRGSAITNYLQNRYGMYLNGIMLISSILDFQTVEMDPGNDLAYIVILPTYAATAWYHSKLDAKLQLSLADTLAEVEAFATGEYATTLLQGDGLAEGKRRSVIRKLARYTGLSERFIDQSNLRIDLMRFTKELLRDQQRTVGRLDSRFVGIDRDPTRESFEYDPSYAVIHGPYSATFNDYVRRELKFESDDAYEILTSKVRPWKYDKHENQYVSVTEALRSAISQNPYLKVFVASGFFDFATPYYATLHTFNHLGLEQTLRNNIVIKHYEAGHMMYTHLPSLAELKRDLEAFISQTKNV